ncbi:MAG: FixH family protein [Bacteroidota bacterium]|nr:FixH family protein [Bacteroidota bacterium]
MKIKFNWGFGIVVSFILFALATFVMVYISVSTNVDLVTEDYYEKELKYQQHIDLVKRTSALTQNIDINITETNIILKYPNLGAPSAYSGVVYFFRPSDKRGDFQKNVGIDSTYMQSFSTEQMQQGLWRAKIFWSVDKKEYYSELPIIIQ